MFRIKPAYNIAQDRASNILEIMEVCSLPVNLEKIINDYPRKIVIKTFSWYSKMSGLSVEEVVSFYCSDSGFTQRDLANDRYVIYMNDVTVNRRRRRWTLAHEFGHIVLNHFDKIGENKINVNDYDLYEREANCFARCLLAPPHVLFAANIESSVSTIMTACDISFEAAKKISDFNEVGKKNGWSKKYGSLKPHSFSRYIDIWKNGTVCTFCGAQSYIKKDYCHVCGEKYTQWKGINGMNYSSIDLGPGNRAKKCPKCNNENIIGDNCQICGALIVNRCLNFYPESNYHYDDNECGKLAPGDARYCPDCGHETSFLRDGHLPPWEDKTAQKTEDLPIPFDL